ncbi:MAG TPA: hypothetical protein VKB80_14470 [Kofleriaceae bacterium]|nr:hypothetical protein [Kofleriaceae bacterium]
MARFFLAMAVAMAAACGPSGQASSKPTGTPTDPVLVCERVADVCRLDDSRLGVCIQPPAGPPPEACAGRSPCFICTPQH